MQLIFQTSAGRLAFSDRAPLQSHDKAQYKIVHRALRNAQPGAFEHEFSWEGRLDDEFVVRLFEPTWTHGGYFQVSALSLAEEKSLIENGFQAAPAIWLRRRREGEI